MMVKFDSNVAAITMFGDVAVTLLKAMGQSGVVPGALLAQDIPPALERLRKAVSGGPPAADGEPEQKEPKVSLAQRAFPLIDLLERSAKAGADVIWSKA